MDFIFGTRLFGSLEEQVCCMVCVRVCVGGGCDGIFEWGGGEWKEVRRIERPTIVVGEHDG